MDDGGAWPTHTTFTVLGNRLYAFVNGTVYRFTPGPNPTDLGSWEDLDSPWPAGFIGNAKMVVGALPAYGVVMAIPAGEEAGPFVWKP